MIRGDSVLSVIENWPLNLDFTAIRLWSLLNVFSHKSSLVQQCSVPLGNLRCFSVAQIQCHVVDFSHELYCGLICNYHTQMWNFNVLGHFFWLHLSVCLSHLGSNI